MSQLEIAPASEVVAWAIGTYADRFAIATSFQKEGMVIIDLASRVDPAVRVFTLDTGRLPEETHQMIDTVRQRYGIAVEVVLPDPRDVEPMVSRHGANLFYRSVEDRHMCCDVRKVRPLERKLREFRAWATGLRREQSATRADVRKLETVDGRMRVCPLADWTISQVDEYMRQNRVPVHPLYHRGYASIGCAPCTRALDPGEDERAGRWWWELDAKKECGIHFSAAGLAKPAGLFKPG